MTAPIAGAGARVDHGLYLPSPVLHGGGRGGGRNDHVVVLCCVGSMSELAGQALSSLSRAPSATACDSSGEGALSADEQPRDL